MESRVNLIYDRNSEILIEVYFKPIFEFIFLVLSNRNNKKKHKWVVEDKKLPEYLRN